MIKTPVTINKQDILDLIDAYAMAINPKIEIEIWDQILATLDAWVEQEVDKRTKHA
jgi:hypothetical protein